MSNLINEKYNPLVYSAIAATSLAAIGICIPFEPIKIISMTVLTSVGYGIANDMIACRDCIEYFTVGHFYDERNLRYRPINSLNPNLNAVVWGMIATWHVACIAGVFLAILARIPLPKITKKVTASQLAPSLLIGAAVTLVISHITSRSAQNAMIQTIEQANQGSAPHPMKYFDVPTNLQARWEACNVRNTTGYAALALGGIAFSIAIIATRLGFIQLKPLQDFLPKFNAKAANAA